MVEKYRGEYDDDSSQLLGGQGGVGEVERGGPRRAGASDSPTTSIGKCHFA